MRVNAHCAHAFLTKRITSRKETPTEEKSQLAYVVPHRNLDRAAGEKSSDSNASKRNSINGMLLLDKPYGMSSNAALGKVKYLFSARKAGHTGSLDPLATGMLPICFGETTKFARFLLNANKMYTTVIQLGVQTTTGDAEGEVVLRDQPWQGSVDTLDSILQQFIGSSWQTPSIYSALKYRGTPLYKLARVGKAPCPQPRKIHISSLELLDYIQCCHQIQLRVVCSKGTYIRSLAEDIGKALGCSAYITQLRRLQVAGYQEQQMISLHRLQQFFADNSRTQLQRYLLPIDSPIADWPTVCLVDFQVEQLGFGQSVDASCWVQEQALHLCDEGDSVFPCPVRLIRAYDRKFLGIGEVGMDGTLIPKRLIAQIKPC